MEERCVFCQIIKGEKPAKFLYQDDTLVVFKDIHPHAPVHLLVVPKKHIRSINDVTNNEAGVISELVLRGKESAKEAGIADSGYKLLFNVERGGGQVIFHLHLHLLGGWRDKTAGKNHCRSRWPFRDSIRDVIQTVFRTCYAKTKQRGEKKCD